MVGGAAFSVSMAKPAAALYSRHEGGALGGRDHVVDIVEDAAASLVHEVEQPERPRAAVSQDQLRHRPAERRVIGRERAGRHPVVQHHRAKVRASMIAWLAPFDPVGYIACAASPISATAPSTHVGTGSRSIIGFS
jgi:hypothetical protein